MNRPVGNLNIPDVVIYAVYIPFSRIDSRGGHNRLERRPRFVQVDDGPVAILFGASLAEFIQIIPGPAGHSQDFARLGVHDDDCRAFGTAPLHDAVQTFFRQELNRTVQRQPDGSFLVGQYLFQGRIKNRYVILIGHEPEGLHVAPYFFIQNHFDAVQALVVFPDEPDDLRG